jgi:hypothetical protein
MTIQQAAYDLAKSVKDSPRRGQVREVVRSLNVATKDGTKDRSSFGYHARQLRCQALGYLLIDQNRGTLPFSIPPLDEDERGVLEVFHNELAWLNKELLAEAFGGTPIPVDAADPYARFRHKAAGKPPEAEFLPNDLREQLRGAFRSHPGVKQARETMPGGLQKIPPADYISSITRFGQAIEAAGVHDAPDDIVKLALSRDSGSVEGSMFRHLTAMASICTSLRVVDQLMYQALLYDKIPVASDDNVIKVIKQNRNVIGQGLTILYMWSKEMSHVEPMDLILVRKEIMEHTDNALCLVHGVRISFSVDAGTTNEIALRVLDSNLNPYPGLSPD